MRLVGPTEHVLLELGTQRTTAITLVSYRWYEIALHN